MALSGYSLFIPKLPIWLSFSARQVNLQKQNKFNRSLQSFGANCSWGFCTREVLVWSIGVPSTKSGPSKTNGSRSSLLSRFWDLGFLRNLEKWEDFKAIAESVAGSTINTRHEGGTPLLLNGRKALWQSRLSRAGSAVHGVADFTELNHRELKDNIHNSLDDALIPASMPDCEMHDESDTILTEMADLDLKEQSQSRI